MKNLEEFKALIERYETITLEEIKTEYNKNSSLIGIPNKLTGYGNVTTCTLCLAVRGCGSCVWYETLDRVYDYPCGEQDNYTTYHDIGDAWTIEMLLEAYRKRAKHMKNMLELIDYAG